MFTELALSLRRTRAAQPSEPPRKALVELAETYDGGDIHGGASSHAGLRRRSQRASTWRPYKSSPTSRSQYVLTLRILMSDPELSITSLERSGYL